LGIKSNNFDFINSGSAAFVIVVCAAYASALTFFIYSQQNLSSAEILVLSSVAIAYLVIGTFGFSYCRRSGSLLMAATYFVVQLSLAAVLIFLRGSVVEFALILLPLAAHSALLFRFRAMLLVCALIYIILVMPLLLRKNWVDAIVVALVHGTGLVFVVVFTRIAVSERDARRSLSEANLQLREHAAQVEELATTKERNRLAREIHDSLGHYLTVVNVQIEAARAIFLRDSDRALKHLAQAQSLTQEGLAEVRRSVAALRASPLANLPLTSSLTKLAEQWNTVDLQVGLKVTGTVRRLSPAAELTLYRTAQEALTNVGRHAGASKVDLCLNYGDDRIVLLKVKDDGCGSESTEEGFGLLGIKERIHALNGKVTIHTSAGNGFELEVEVPE
jgi:signal transduction histidine kinase